MVTQTNIVQPMHPLSTARSGAVAVNKTNTETGWAQPAASAQIISQLAPGQATEFEYRMGDAMDTGKAASCRVFYSGNVTTQYTSSTGWLHFISRST